MVPSNEVLAERIRSLENSFYTYREYTNAKLADAENRIAGIKEQSDDQAFSVKSIHLTIEALRETMNDFISVVNEQQKSTSDQKKEYDEQNKMISEFINSDKRASHKRDFYVDILKVVAGIISGIIIYYITGVV